VTAYAIGDANSARAGERDRSLHKDLAPGTVFEISEAELAHADAYEVAAYVRVKAPLASGLEAWVYVDARDKPPPA
jgi:hypothetical protein